MKKTGQTKKVDPQVHSCIPECVYIYCTVMVNVYAMSVSPPASAKVPSFGFLGSKINRLALIAV